MLPKLGIDPGFAMDITTNDEDGKPWNFDEKEQKEKVEKDGFFLPKNLITKKNERKCPVCGTFSFEIKDDLYMNKFECCFKCYIQYVELNEEKWLKGWRPNDEKKNTKKKQKTD